MATRYEDPSQGNLESEQVENSLLVAHRKAVEVLGRMDPEEVCLRTGVQYNAGMYSIRFLDRTFELSLPGGEFNPRDIPIVEVLVLHYLSTRGNNPEKGEYLSFSALPGGMFYSASFQQRALNKMIARFGEKPEDFTHAAVSLGGTPWKTGDCDYSIPVLPKINVVVQIFQGDDEFPPDGNVLFPDCVVNFLPTEDTAFLGGYLVGMLARAAQK